MQTLRSRNFWMAYFAVKDTFWTASTRLGQVSFTAYSCSVNFNCPPSPCWIIFINVDKRMSDALFSSWYSSIIFNALSNFKVNYSDNYFQIYFSGWLTLEDFSGIGYNGYVFVQVGNLKYVWSILIQKLIRITNVEFIPSAPLAQNRCYKKPFHSQCRQNKRIGIKITFSSNVLPISV